MDGASSPIVAAVVVRRVVVRISAADPARRADRAGASQVTRDAPARLDRERFPRNWDARRLLEVQLRLEDAGGQRSVADLGQGRPGRGLRGLTRVTGPALQGRAGDWRLTNRTPACDTTTRCRPSRLEVERLRQGIDDDAIVRQANW